MKVEIEEDHVLKISGERKTEKEDKNDTWHRVEHILLFCFDDPRGVQATRPIRVPEEIVLDG
ncbi:hypothetical protein RYX36_006260 [Vicia faba]